MQKKYLVTAVLSLLLVNPALSTAEGKDGVAAVVNGEKITVSDIRQTYEANPQVKAQMPFDEYYNRALDYAVSTKLVDQAAAKAKITETKEYKKQLEIAKKELAKKVYIESQVDKNISDADLNKLYDEYKGSFKPEKEIKAKHILVDNEATAKEVIAKLKKGGNFDTLAKQYSKDASDLGYFTEGTMVPEFSEAAFKLKKGQYTQTPVKTQYGYHIIKVEDIRDTKPADFKTVRPQLKPILAEKAIVQTIGGLNEKASMQKYDLKGQPLGK